MQWLRYFSCSSKGLERRHYRKWDCLLAELAHFANDLVLLHFDRIVEPLVLDHNEREAREVRWIRNL